MKKVIFTVGIVVVLTGIGLFVGRCIGERHRINDSLAQILPDIGGFCQDKSIPVPSEELRAAVCKFQQEENEAIKQAARSSRTNKEFLQKSQEILERNTKKMNEILKPYLANLQPKEEVAQ